MLPLIYLYENSFEGLLTAVALAAKNKQQVDEIWKKDAYRPTLFAKTNVIESDSAQAERIFSYIRNLSADAVHLTINAFLSEEGNIGTSLLGFITLSLIHKNCIMKMHAEEAVRRLHEISYKVDNEAHRLKGLLRFRILKTGQLYAPFSPDHNVIGYLADHFAKRMGNRAWLLHDVKRDSAIFWNGKELHPVTVDPMFTKYVAKSGDLPDNELSEEERYYQVLWKSFHQSTENKGRENVELQRHFMPKRYWHFMVEMKK